MPLFTYTDQGTSTPQPAIGKNDHWNSFVVFQGSPLHNRFVELIEQHIAQEKIVNSGHLGKKILSELQGDCDPQINGVDPNILGSLFGMSLWNQLATHPQNWRFLKEEKGPRREFSGTVYFLEP